MQNIEKINFLSFKPAFFHWASSTCYMLFFYIFSRIIGVCTLKGGKSHLMLMCILANIFQLDSLFLRKNRSKPQFSQLEDRNHQRMLPAWRKDVRAYVFFFCGNRYARRWELAYFLPKDVCATVYLSLAFVEIRR